MGPVKSIISALLQHLSEASMIAQRIENESYLYDNAAGDEENSLEDFLFDQYVTCVPEGIAKRRAENEQIEQDFEQESKDFCQAELGYMFTFNRPAFWELLRNTPEEVK